MPFPLNTLTADLYFYLTGRWGSLWMELTLFSIYTIKATWDNSPVPTEVSAPSQQTWWFCSCSVIPDFLVILCSVAHSCSVHGISQARIAEWVAMSFSRGSSWPRDQACISCLGRHIIYHWATKEAPINVWQFSLSVVSDSLWPHGQQNARLPCPSPSPRACSNSHPSLSQWCHPTISSSVIPFSCLHSFPVSGSSLMSWLFASGGQSTWASASASVLPMNIQDWFPLGLTG